MRTTSTRAAHARRRFPYLKRTALVAAGVLAVAGLGMQSANAAVVVTTTQNASTAVGATDTITIKLTGTGETVSQVNLIPSCSGAIAGPAIACSATDLGVFSIAVDSAASTCDEVAPGAFLSLGGATPNGVFPISIIPAIAPPVGPGGCVIVVKRTALKLPVDADLATPATRETRSAASAIANGVETATSAPALTTVTPGATSSGSGACNVPGAIVLGSGSQTYTSPVAGTNDVIDAGSGNDVVNGNGGNDTICGGSGNDQITTTTGTDAVFGGSGNDVISTGAGADQIFAGSGNDDITAGGDPGDTVDGGSGNNTIH